MSTLAHRHDDLAVYVLDGELDWFARDAFLAEMRELFAAGVRRLVLDMRRVRFVSAAGLAALLVARALFHDGQGDLGLLDPSIEVASTIALAGLAGQLPVTDGDDDFRSDATAPTQRTR